MSQPFKLFRLQQIDSQLDQARARLAAIEAQLADDAILKEAQEQAASAASNLDQAHKELRAAENKVRAQRTKIEQSESTLYSGKVRNPKELQDIQKEVAALKRYLVTLEDRQLEGMLYCEDLEQVYQVAADHLEKVHQDRNQIHLILRTEHQHLSAEINRMVAERQAALGPVPPEDLKVYSRLRQQRSGIAVSKVTDKSCSACGSLLTAAQLHAARSPSQLTFCDTCGRILYSG